MRLLDLAICLVLGVLGPRPTAAAPRSGPPFHAEQQETAPSAVFRGDTRLESPVTLAAKNQPMRAVLAALGQQVQVPLTAGGGVADDKVTLFVDARPAAEVLSLLARHFDFRWSPLFRGYELRQDSGGRQREAAHRGADLQAEWQEVQFWLDRLAPLVGRPKTQLQERAKVIAGRLQDTALAADERSRLTVEAAALRQAIQPETAPALALLRGLTPAQVAQLRRDNNLLLSREHGSLPPAVPKLTRPADGDADTVAENPTTRPVVADAQVLLLEGWRSIELSSPHPGLRRKTLSVTLTVRFEGPGKRRWDHIEWTPLMPKQEQAAPATSETHDPALMRPVELRLHASSPPGSRPGDKPGNALAHLRTTWAALPTLADVAEALHRATGLEVLSDSFVRGRVEPGWVSGRQPVARILDTLSRQLAYGWKKEGNLLLLRSRSAHWDRAEEVPDRVLRPWQERAARTGAATLDNLAELAAALDDPQTLSMSLYWGWYLEDPWVTPPGPGAERLYSQRRHLRFWAALSPGQRRQALSGAVISGAQMSTPQRQTFLTALTDPFADLSDAGVAFLLSGRRPTPTDLLSGGFRLNTVGWRLQLFSGAKPDGSTDQIVAFHPAYRPPVLSNLPQGAQWSALGEPVKLDKYTFAYHLAGEPQPARTVEMDALPQPRH